MTAATKRIGLALGVGAVLAASVFLVLHLTKPPVVAPVSKGEDEKKTQARQYLKLPGAVSQLPEWLAAEAPFDVKEVFPSIPDDENGAPLYLELLIEFGTELVVLYPMDQHESLRQRYRPKITNFYRLSEAWDKDRKSVSAAELDALLKEFEAGFERLAEAQKRPRCVFETGITISTLLPHVQSVRNVANVVQLQTARDIERGEIERPLRLLEIVLRLSRDLRHRAVTICQLVATASDTIAYKALTEILDSPRCTKEHCDRLLGLLALHEKEMPDAAGTAISMEYIVVRSAMRDIEHRTGDFSPESVAKLNLSFGQQGVTIGILLAGLSSGDPRTAAQRAKQIDARIELLTAADYAREAETLKSYFRDLLETARKPFPQAKIDLNRLQNVAGKSLFLSLFNKSDIISFETILSNVARSTALLRGTQCLVALRRWQLEGKEAPAALASVLKTIGITGVPTDPYAHAAFKMTQRGGQPVIYSIGPDLADDGARLESDGRSNGDLVFRLAVPFK